MNDRIPAACHSDTTTQVSFNTSTSLCGLSADTNAVLGLGE